MRRSVVLLLLLFTSATLSLPAQRKAKRGPTLTLAVAAKLLGQHINDASVDNTLWTCRACYDPDDKEENEAFVVVTVYSNLSQFLVRRGYIRMSRDRNEVFTARAKRSRYFEAWGNEEGGFGGAGFRFANFRNAGITVSRIDDPRHVPIEYDLVPTDVTLQFFGGVRRVQTFASFSYESHKWNVCTSCRR